MENNFPYLISTTNFKPEFTQFQKITLTSETFSIGRGVDNNFVMPFMTLSKNHCKFKKIDKNKWTIEDSSTFGIQVNDVRLEKSRAYTLNSNDIIRFDMCNDFEYKFVLIEEEEPPKKIRKIEEISPNLVHNELNKSQNAKIKFMESNIKSTQQLQIVSIKSNKWLNLELEKKIQLLNEVYKLLVANLTGEKNEIELQKLQLKQERDAQIDGMKQETEMKSNYLMEELKQHYVKEVNLLKQNSLLRILRERLIKERDDFLLTIKKEKSSKQSMLTEFEGKIKQQELMHLQEKQQLEEIHRKNEQLKEELKQHCVNEMNLLKENSILRERLIKERDDFLLTINEENSSKQSMLAEFEGKIKQQELMHLQEKQQLKETLHRKNEQLKLTKEKELKDLKEKSKLREKELELAHENEKNLLENQIEQTKQKQLEAEEQLHLKIKKMKKIDKDKAKMKQLLKKAKEDAKKKISEAQSQADYCVKKLQKKDRDLELATLATDKIQLKLEQSNEVICNLEKQLKAAKSQLRSIEEKRNNTIPISAVAEIGESSKQSAMAKIGEIMESELQCTVCCELLMDPVRLGCGHSFCSHCITRWRQNSQDCPNCRSPITSEKKDLLFMSFIEKMVKNLDEETKKKREQLIKDREELEAELSRRLQNESLRVSSVYSSNRFDWDDDNIDDSAEASS